MSRFDREDLIASMWKHGVPEHMHEGVADYILHGKQPGGFLTAVICGHLFEALARADGMNIAALPAYGMFFYNDAPGGCYGSPAKFDGWMDHRGLEGRGK